MKQQIGGVRERALWLTGRVLCSAEAWPASVQPALHCLHPVHPPACKAMGDISPPPKGCYWYSLEPISPEHTVLHCTWHIYTGQEVPGGPNWLVGEGMLQPADYGYKENVWRTWAAARSCSVACRLSNIHNMDPVQGVHAATLGRCIYMYPALRAYDAKRF